MPGGTLQFFFSPAVPWSVGDAGCAVCQSTWCGHKHLGGSCAGTHASKCHSNRPPHPCLKTLHLDFVCCPRAGHCLQVMKHSRLLSSSSTAFLQQKLQLRAPYVAPLNILQVRAVQQEGRRCIVGAPQLANRALMRQQGGATSAGPWAALMLQLHGRRACTHVPQYRKLSWPALCRREQQKPPCSSPFAAHPVFPPVCCFPLAGAVPQDPARH